MAEPQGFALLFAVVLVLVGLPLFLLSIVQYVTQPSSAFATLAIGAAMLFIGAIFLIVLLTQK
jgi:hypothetical protein